MKKALSVLVALVLLLCGLAALAEGETEEEVLVDTSEWAYYTFEGSAVAMLIPGDFEPVTDEPEPGVFYDCGNADVILQVTPVEEDIADLDALEAYYSNLDYIDLAAQAEINGVQLVYVEGADDNVQILAVKSPEGTVYQFLFFPLSDQGPAVIDAIISSVCSSDSVGAAGFVIAPMPVDVDLEALQDGIYPAAFELDALKDGALTVTIYTVDCYDIVDISMLKEGDSIVIGGLTVEVESLNRENGLEINGGLLEGGYDLMPFEEDNCWRVVELDDYPTWTEHGEATLPLDEAVTFTDAWNLEVDPVTYSGAEEVAKAIAGTDFEYFDQLNTTIRVENGKIVEISRIFTP